MRFMSLSLAFTERIAEERIKETQGKGAFDNLPGRGKPLDPDDGANVPEELRMAWRVLKNAGCLPPESWRPNGRSVPRVTCWPG